MKNISLNIDKVAKFISKEGISAYEPLANAAMKTLEEGTGLGNDFLGWLHLPSTMSKELLEDLKATAKCYARIVKWLSWPVSEAVTWVHVP